MEAEFWAHHYAENAAKGGEEFEDDDFDLQAILDEIGGDDEWEEVINDRS